MSGWSAKKRTAVEEAFYQFLSHCYVDSKDFGRICLGQNLYDGQIRVITEIFDALEEDIHDIYILKSRQLGISTLVRALTVFMLGVLPGLKGALVFDTAPNRDEARSELVAMIKNLPDEIRFPAVKGSGEGNREGLTLENNSRILFKAAGVKKSAGSGTLGRSIGLSLATMSELCSYDNDEGMESFRQSLSDINPDRLYIYESTARGFNHWNEMWREAREDVNHCRCIFLGWWSKPSQKIERGSVDWAMYGEDPPTEKELERIKEVRERYYYEVSAEQLAWFRRKMDPTRAGEDEDLTRLQEQPWTEDEAFQQTGSVFFPAEKLTDESVNHCSHKYQSFFYGSGVEFVDVRVYKSPNYKSTELKVWDEPDTDGVYVLGVDPAYGENEKNDRSCVQVLRCYADGVDQVAEYAWSLINTRQLAWVIASLLGWYGAGRAEARYILELNGPGMAVFNELRSLKHQIDNAYQLQQYEEQGLRDIFRNVRTYIYARPDAMSGSGTAWHWKTTMANKVTLMERMRDFVSNGMLHIRSSALIEEMRTVAREGDNIKAPGNMKDDRVLAMALAVLCWEEKVRRQMITQKRTRASEEARKLLTITNQVALFQQNQLQAFFDRKRNARVRRQVELQKHAWRYR